MCTHLYHFEKFQLTKIWSVLPHFFSCVTTIFPEFIWLTKWKDRGHTHLVAWPHFSASK